jgi:membrane-associated phospholipid phosphatase
LLGIARSGLSRPLLPPASRRPAALAAAGCVIVVAALGLAYAGQAHAGAFDRWADAVITGHPGVTSWTRWVIGVGTPEAALPICLAAAAWCAVTRRYRAVALIAIAVPVASVSTDWVLKPLFGRTNIGALTYPSGHTTGACVMAAAAIVVLAGPSRPPLPAAARRLLCAAAALLVPVVAVGLVYVHFHYLTDTIGGAGVATAAVLLTALAVDAAAGALPAPPSASPQSARTEPSRTGSASPQSASPGPAGERPGISAPARELPRA